MGSSPSKRSREENSSPQQGGSAWQAPECGRGAGKGSQTRQRKHQKKVSIQSDPIGSNWIKQTSSYSSYVKLDKLQATNSTPPPSATLWAQSWPRADSNIQDISSNIFPQMIFTETVEMLLDHFRPAK